MNGSDIPMEPQRYPVPATVAAQQKPQMAALSADGQICVTDVGVDAGRQVAPLAREQSVGEMDPRAPGWTRRYVDFQWYKLQKLVTEI